MTQRARDLMNAPVMTVESDTPLVDATRLFVDEELHGAPVVGKGGRLVGYLSTSDLLRAIDDEQDRPTAEGPKLRVADAMEIRVFTVPEDAPISEVAALLRAASVHRVIVMREETPVGMISSLDLLTLLEDR